MAKPNHFCWADIWTFWYFDVSVWSDEKKMGLSGLCQNSVTAPYCKDWEARYPPNTSERLWCPWIPLRYPQTQTTSTSFCPCLWCYSAFLSFLTDQFQNHNLLNNTTNASIKGVNLTSNHDVKIAWAQTMHTCDWANPAFQQKIEDVSALNNTTCQTEKQSISEDYQ